MARQPFPASIPAIDVLRQQGMDAHAINIKRLNIALDAAVLVGRHLGLIRQGATVMITGAQHQNDHGTTANHAAHGMKRFTFDGRDITAIYTAPGVDPLMRPLLAGLLGSTTMAPRTANLSIDRTLENNPARRQQLQDVVNQAHGAVPAMRLAAEAMERARVAFDRVTLQRLRADHAGDAGYIAMIAAYDRALCGTPGLGEKPGRMIDQLIAAAR